MRSPLQPTRMEKKVTITKLASVVTVCATTLAVVGCGGSSQSGSASSAANQPKVRAQHPAVSSQASNLDTGQFQARPAPNSTSVGANRKDQPAHHKGGAKVQEGQTNSLLSGDDHNPPGASGSNPCKLVSVAQARTILGGTVIGSSEAPLGPTCVYKLSHSKSSITVAVEQANLSQVATHMVKRQQTTVRGRHGYCGKLGAPMLYVNLGRGQILHVVAPCGVARQFAAVALDRLSA
jgi:hypothetical protein